MTHSDNQPSSGSDQTSKSQTPSEIKDKFAKRLRLGTELLNWLHEKGYPALIAGGYARDTILGLPIRDIDLYVVEDSYRSVMHLLANSNDIDAADINYYDREDPQYDHQYISMQSEFNIRDDFEITDLASSVVNIIGVRTNLDAENTVSKFNFGICMAYIDRVKGIGYTWQFKEDFKDKQITLLRTDWGLEASMKQLIKLSRKTGWPVRVVPEAESTGGEAWADIDDPIIQDALERHG